VEEGFGIDFAGEMALANAIAWNRRAFELMNSQILRMSTSAGGLMDATKHDWSSFTYY
jgi:hypothetical protein